MFTGPNIIKGDGALGAKGASDDNIHGLVMGGVTSAGYATLGVSKSLIQASDADAFGLTAAYDSTNKVLVRYHIDEYFRLNPNGVLWIMVVAQATTLANMCDKTLAHVQKLISDSDKKVKSIGVVRNPATGYVSTITDGIDADVTAAVLKAQELADAWRAQNIFIDMIVIEGRELGATASAWKDLRTLASPNVHVCVLQDKDVAALDTLYAKTAAVGTCLGGIGVRRAEEDLGQLPVEGDPQKGRESYPINDAAKSLWLRPAISSGVETKDLTAPEVKALIDKGFIFADSYPEHKGVYFSGSPACTAATSDFAYGVNTRVWNKGARKVLVRLILKTNGKVKLVGGKITQTTIASWQEDINGQKGLGALVTDETCTSASVYINPNQDVFGTSKVVTKMAITPYGYSRVIEGELGFSL